MPDKVATITPSKQASLPSTQPPFSEQLIRERAYQVYEERGHQDGHDLDDWLQAEIEISGSKPKALQRSEIPANAGLATVA